MRPRIGQPYHIMRLPLLLIMMVLTLGICIDVYIAFRLRRSLPDNKALRRVHAAISTVFGTLLIVLICLPKRTGGESGLEMIMWGLYAYFSLYLPKIIFAIFDIFASLPRLWHHHHMRALDVAGGTLGVIVFLTMWWGALINRFNIDVHEVEIEIDGLPENFDGYRLVQISDMHVGSYGTDTAFVADVVTAVNGLDPDLIVFTGDIVNRRSDELRPFTATLSRLSAPDGVYSILGNHDYGDYYTWTSEHDKQANMDELLSMQRSMGWTMLNNSHRFIRRGNDSIALIGVENVGDPPFRTYGDLDAAYPELADPNVKILLSHNPAHWNNDIKDSPDKNIALTLAGHTHAMQMSAFGFSPAVFRYPTWGGLYKDNDRHQLYVNIGLGEVGIPARIGATPEITLITLKAK